MVARPDGARQCRNVNVSNVLPLTTRTYGPIGTLSAATGALVATCRGAGFFRGIGGTIFNCAGTSVKLYKLASGAWSNITRSSAVDYAVQTEDMWAFTQFGDRVIAVNGTDNVQYYDIGSSTNFEPLAGSPPIGRYVASVRDFVFIGRIVSAANKLQWSGFNNSANWTIGTNQSDDAEIPTGNKIMGIVGGEYATVFSEEAINRFTYVGTPIIFQRDNISVMSGTACENSIVGHQGLIFYVSYEGFFMLDRSGSQTPIGDQKVDRFFWSNVNQSYLHKVIATVDPINKLYCVAFPSSSSTSGAPDMIMFFNWAIGRWSIATISVEYLYSASSNESYNIDNIDTLYGNLDAIPISLDSGLLTGSGKASLGAFGTDHTLGFFNGANMAAVMETTEGNINAGGRALVTEVWPLIDGGSPSVQIGTRELPQDSVTWGSTVAQIANGMVPMLSNASYHRARIITAAGANWAHCSGIDITVRKVGRF